MLKTIVNLPSGRFFEIREQNGHDDEVLTSYLGSGDDELAMLDRFLGNIVLREVDAESNTLKDSIGLADIQGLLARDKYALLIKSRIFSLGGMMHFSYQFPPDNLEEDFVENLGDYVWDYTLPVPQIGQEEYHPNRILPYDSTNKVELKLPSGKLVTWEPLTAKGESSLNSSNNSNINVEIKARNLSIDGTPVNNFSIFGARDMAMIRSSIRENDFLKPLNMTLTSPITGEEIMVPLLGVPDFFFPTRL